MARRRRSLLGKSGTTGVPAPAAPTPESPPEDQDNTGADAAAEDASTEASPVEADTAPSAADATRQSTAPKADARPPIEGPTDPGGVAAVEADTDPAPPSVATPISEPAPDALGSIGEPEFDPLDEGVTEPNIDLAQFRTTPSEAPPVPRQARPAPTKSALGSLLGKARGVRRGGDEPATPAGGPVDSSDMPSYLSEPVGGVGGAPEPLVDLGGDDQGALEDFGAEPPTDEVERTLPEPGPSFVDFDAPLEDEETQLGVNLDNIRGDNVTERSYSASSESSAPVDTTDTGWDSSVHDSPSAPTSSAARSGNSVLGRARGGSAPRQPAEPVKPMSTPSAPMPLFGDDVGGPEEGLPGGMSDLSDFDAGGEGPPTEEVPSAVLEDLGQLYNASMSVPEPSPLPELFSGNEAATEPAGHPGISSRTPPPVPKAPPPRYESSTPPPTSNSGAELPRTPPPARPMVYSEEDDEEVEIGEGGGWLMIVAGVIVMFTLAGVVAAGLVAANRGSSSGGGEVPVEVVAPKPPPVVAPTETPPPTEVGTPEGTEPAEGAGEGTAEGTDPAVDASTEASTEAPAEASAPPPKEAAAPPVKPVVTQPKPPPAVKENIPAGMGTIKIRANKRVIVQVNGNLLDFAPVDLPFSAGNHTVGAMLPGRPDSLQEKPIKLRKGKTVTVEFDF